MLIMKFFLSTLPSFFLQGCDILLPLSPLVLLISLILISVCEIIVRHVTLKLSE